MKISKELDISIDAKIFVSDQDFDKLDLGRMNYARFFIDDYFNVDDYIYIDTDIIVLGNIKEIWQIYKNNKKDNKYFAAVMVDNLQFLLLPEQNYQHLYLEYNGLGFNAGIYITSSTQWRENDIFKQILELIKNTKGHFNLGTQPILNLLFYGKIIELPIEWNICSYTIRSDIELINHIISYFNLDSVNVNLMNEEFIKKNRIKLLHFTVRTNLDKYWTFENFVKFGFEGNGFYILNRFFYGKHKELFTSELKKDFFRYFYFYLKYKYKLQFTDNISNLNFDEDIVHI